MRTNMLKAGMRAGAKPLGTFVDTASSYVVECIGRTGFDYIIIDNEHSPVEAETEWFKKNFPDIKYVTADYKDLLAADDIDAIYTDVFTELDW